MNESTSAKSERRILGTFAGVTLVVQLVVGVILGLMPAIVGLILLFGARLQLAIGSGRGSEHLAARRRAWAACLGVLLGALLFGAAVVAVYVGSFSFTRDRCEAAEMAPTLGERKAIVASMDELAWLKWATGRLTTKGVFLFDCDGVKRILHRLEADGECPRFPPADTPCRCGRDAWTGASDCQGQTLCDRTFERTGLRCEEDHSRGE